jgi:hypothetical protein
MTGPLATGLQIRKALNSWEVWDAVDPVKSPASRLLDEVERAEVSLD